MWQGRFEQAGVHRRDVITSDILEMRTVRCETSGVKTSEGGGRGVVRAHQAGPDGRRNRGGALIRTSHGRFDQDDIELAPAAFTCS